MKLQPFTDGSRTGFKDEQGTFYYKQASLWKGKWATKPRGRGNTYVIKSLAKLNTLEAAKREAEK